MFDNSPNGRSVTDGVSTWAASVDLMRNESRQQILSDVAECYRGADVSQKKPDRKAVVVLCSAGQITALFESRRIIAAETSSRLCAKDWR